MEGSENNLTYVEISALLPIFQEKLEKLRSDNDLEEILMKMKIILFELKQQKN